MYCILEHSIIYFPLWKPCISREQCTLWRHSACDYVLKQLKHRKFCFVQLQSTVWHHFVFKLHKRTQLRFVPLYGSLKLNDIIPCSTTEQCTSSYVLTVLYCIVLYCIVLYCIVLYCIVLYCIVLYCIVLYCIVLYCIVLYCIVLYCRRRPYLCFTYLIKLEF